MLEKLPEVVGHVLRNSRAGLDKTAYHMIDLRHGTGAITVTSLAFRDHEPIPARYTADGEGLSPPLEWTGIPANAASLVLMVEDADAPTPHPLVHAIATDLEPRDGFIQEGMLNNDGEHADSDIHIGKNSYFRADWLPPDPPPGHGQHRYAFQLFALDIEPGFSGSPGRDAVLGVLEQHAIASGCLIGTYERPDGSVKVNVLEPVTAPTEPDVGLT